MARNKVQFQKGLSEAQFDELYGTEERCHAELCPRSASTRSHITMRQHVIAELLRVLKPGAMAKHQPGMGFSSNPLSPVTSPTPWRALRVMTLPGSTKAS